MPNQAAARASFGAYLLSGAALGCLDARQLDLLLGHATVTVVAGYSLPVCGCEQVPVPDTVDEFLLMIGIL